MAGVQDRREPASWAANDGVAKSMRSNRRRDTKPELAVRRMLHARGLRYRVDYAPGPDKRRRADIVFTRQKVAVFIDGCFWHGCPEHATIPKAHADYWVRKLARNRERDVETTAELEAEGWTVLRFWEHEDPKTVANAIAVRIHACDHSA
ncbi:very short patch repair endonuclease [Acidipropionibacterium acidipropionici]|uniref:very short patch repair endonuclease n=2 Tax=Acidipropionibacterium acidipropionici TaxID=1748 RepID=UPI00055B91D4|nr:very short patch repair endonuclease [Acidipropionibacterium acidipropionici]